MDTIDEKPMLSLLSKAKRVLLVEPYKGKYMPLGLAKIASFVKANGGEARYVERGYGAASRDCDLVAVSTLCTYDSALYRAAIEEISSATDATILVGGICASLAPGLLESSSPRLFEPKNVVLFKGYSPELDARVPDYSIDWGERDGWEKFSYVFTTRGCPNKCAYCAVPKIEKTTGGLLVTPNWREHIVPERRTCVVLDNNFTSAPREHVREVIEFLAGQNLIVIMENGVDCKHIDEEIAGLLGRVRWDANGLRIAFDRISEDGVFQDAVRLLLKHGVDRRKIMAYVLFNFHDKPRDAAYRLMECAKLGIQPYPQRFSPLDQPNRHDIHVGKHWTKRLGMAFQHYGIMGKFRVKGSKTKFVSFEEFARRPDVRKRFKLSDEDIAKLDV